MLNKNLKLAFRNILRNKLYATINIIGLGLASAFCILVYLYVKKEQSFDRFHHDTNQLYRLEVGDVFSSSAKHKPTGNFFSFLMKDAEQTNMIQTPTALAVDLKRNFPEIENAVRLEGLGAETIRVGNQSFKEKDDNLTYADADFFSVFNFPLISGAPSTVMSGRNQAVISERLALKYFGSTNVVGKTLLMPNEANQPPITVSGVFKNFPSNSSFQFDMVLPVESNPDYKANMERGVNSYSDPLILKFKQGTDVVKFQNKMNVFAKTYFKPIVEFMRKHDPKTNYKDVQLYLRPFAEAHYNQAAGWGHYTDLKNIYQLVCLTIVILFIAALNYILLTLTNTISRSQDVGVRKTIGAGKLQIVWQYYTETQLLAIIAVFTGFFIAVLCLPFFGNLTGTAISMADFSIGTIFFFLLVLSVFLGLIAGIYPAFAMAGLKPLNIMRSFSAYKLNPVLSKCLIVAQFAICVILIISALVINKQVNYINQTDMGFNKDQVLIVRSPYGWEDKQKTNALRQNLYHYAATEPFIQDATCVTISFGGFNNNAFLINGEKIMLQDLNVDYNYFSFLNIPIVQGRAFSRDIATDSTKLVLPEEKSKKPAMSLARRAIVVNETLYNLLGKPELEVLNQQMGAVIIGVCRDYHTEDLTKKIQPAYHTINANVIANFWIKIKAGQNLPTAVEKIQASWGKLTNNSPFDFLFMDQEVAKSYESYLRWMTTITISCVLAIIIACLGLFGLSGLTTLNRTKEIGIRKVLGASVSNLFVLLNKGTLLLAAGSFIIAAPISFYLVHQWLDNFAYRIKPDWILFTIAGFIAMATALIAVSYHTIKAATGNPVDNLRSE